MRIQLLIVVVVGLLICAANSRPDYPPGAEALQQRILAHIGPQTRGWIDQEGRRMAAQPSTDIAGDIRAANLGDLSAGDIEELAFVVLMQATNDADQDLQQIMAETQAETKAKNQLRDTMNARGELVAAADNATNAATNDMSNSASPILHRPRFGASTNTMTNPPSNATSDRTGARGAVSGGLDSQSELGETTSMRLQMAMDRRSKLMETLSNLLKQISSTNQAIIQNLK